MFDSPHSLERLCLSTVSENLEAICDYEVPVEGCSRLVLREPAERVFIPSIISEQLLTEISSKGQLTDSSILLFDPEVTRLTKVKITSAKNVTQRGLKILKHHKITHLDCPELKIPVNDLLGCLGDWTMQHLRLLNVSKSSFVTEKLHIVVSLTKLKNLRFLNVSHTDFNRQGLEIVANDLLLLNSLDISGTRVDDLSPLRKCRKRMRYLNLYNVRGARTAEAVAMLLEFENLEFLDISMDPDPEENINLLTTSRSDRNEVRHLLSEKKRVLNLVHLDVSGNDRISVDALESYVLSHQRLRFIGLLQTNACFADIFTDPTYRHYQPDMIVTGFANIHQLLHSLTCYLKRPQYVQRTLYFLFRMTNTGSQTANSAVCVSKLISIVLDVMAEHAFQKGIQMAATACLYNLTKGDAGSRVNPMVLSRLVSLTLDAMTNFPLQMQLQKNTLLTLCSDRILQEVTFNRFRCARLVLDCLCAFVAETTMTRMAVAICSILASKVSTAETSVLGSESKYMKRLLQIVEEKTMDKAADLILRFTLSALWNLSDESPSTCMAFLNERGLDLYMIALATFSSDTAVETKVLGLLNNIAEVESLRCYLRTCEIVGKLRILLHSDHIEVSYFAAGILAHLISDSQRMPELAMEVTTSTDVESMEADAMEVDEKVTDVLDPRYLELEEEIRLELGEVVASWQYPETEMVAYRSFRPFLQLLGLPPRPVGVQMWALWAIHHVCTKNPDRYCPMLLEENGKQILRNLLACPDKFTEAGVLSLARKILEILERPPISRSLPGPPVVIGVNF